MAAVEGVSDLRVVFRGSQRIDRDARAAAKPPSAGSCSFGIMSPALGMPSEFKVPRSILAELPLADRSSITADLWNKANGVCALCGLPLPADGKRIDVDHIKPRTTGGATVLSNLFLAHSFCNKSKGQLDFKLARPIIEFQAWSRQHNQRTFDDVLNKYLRDGKQRVRLTISDSKMNVLFGSISRDAEVFIDPATGTKYAFMNVPVDFIFNDVQSQPRVINAEHVRNLALDFSKHPVHEPSNSRMVTLDHGLAELHQFDGQHKTTAQIILDRKEVPMKLYVDPDLPMIQELVVQIQQGIRKQPLSTTDTLRKLDDVVKDKIEQYRNLNDGLVPTEVQLVDAQPKNEQLEFKKRLLGNFSYLVFSAADFKMREFVSTKADKAKPLTDSVLIRKLIQPLLSQSLLDQPLDAAVQRETERATLIDILNHVADVMLVGKWAPKTDKSESENIHTTRARNFFYQGSLAWSFGKILKPTWTNWMPLPLEGKLFINGMNPDQEERILTSIDDVCGWPIWSAPDTDAQAAMRSNTVANVVKAFPDYDQRRLTHWR